jgi:protein TonB
VAGAALLSLGLHLGVLVLLAIWEPSARWDERVAGVRELTITWEPALDVPAHAAPFQPPRVVEAVETRRTPLADFAAVPPPARRAPTAHADVPAGVEREEPVEREPRPRAVDVRAPEPCADNRPPHYPAVARRRGQEGLVVILVQVRADGRVESASVATSCGHVLLDRAALEAVTAWRFHPGQRSGLAEAQPLEIPIRFRLSPPHER